MKLNKYILATLIGTTTLISCNDFLEVDSPSQFDTNYVFNTESDALKVLLGAYVEFNQDPFSSRMANVWAQNTDVECIAPGDKPDGSRRDVWSLQGGLLENFGDIKKAWDSNYFAIDRANQVIPMIFILVFCSSGMLSLMSSRKEESSSLSGRRPESNK